MGVQSFFTLCMLAPWNTRLTGYLQMCDIPSPPPPTVYSPAWMPPGHRGWCGVCVCSQARQSEPTWCQTLKVIAFFMGSPGLWNLMPLHHWGLCIPSVSPLPVLDELVSPLATDQRKLHELSKPFLATSATAWLVLPLPSYHLQNKKAHWETKYVSLLK